MDELGAVSSARAPSQAAKAAPRSMLTGTAAIRGDQPDLVGDTFGVVRTSASPDGAGVGAANTGGGPDLVLDGSADRGADAVLRESGIDRPSPDPQTFTIDDSGGGGMTLEISGVEVVTTATDQDSLAALSCAGYQVAKWDGADWVCAPDVDPDTLAFLGSRCLSGELARGNGSAWVCDEDADTLAALNCGYLGRIAKWDGSAWACARDQDTTYAPGPGVLLDGGRFQLDRAAFSKRITILDGDGHVGSSTSLAIGTDGVGLISYRDYTNHDLKVVHLPFGL